MPWFKVDDHLTFHPKTLAAGNEAIGAWARLGAYCGAHLTNGRVPEEIALTVCGSKKLVEHMVAVRLLVKVEGGYELHQYLDYNPSREQIENERRTARERKARSRQNGQRTDAVTEPVTDAVSHAVTPTEPTAEVQAHSRRSFRSGWDGSISDASSGSENLTRGLNVDRLLRYWGKATSVLVPAHLHLVAEKLQELGKAKGVHPDTLIEPAVDAMVAYFSSMTPGRKPPYSAEKFCEPKHWSAIQEILAGKRDPKAGAKVPQRQVGYAPASSEHNTETKDTTDEL